MPFYSCFLFKSSPASLFSKFTVLKICKIPWCTPAVDFMLCHVMWNLFTVASVQFCNDGAIASLEANQNRVTQAIVHHIYRNGTA